MLLASTLIPASTLSPAGMEPAGMEPPRIEPAGMMHAMLRMSQPCCEHSPDAGSTAGKHAAEDSARSRLAGDGAGGDGNDGGEAGGNESGGDGIGGDGASEYDARRVVGLGLRDAGSERLSTSFWTSRANWQIGERSERVVQR